MKTTRVLVVDDSAFARKVLREVLERNPGIEVVGTARDGLDALEQIERLQPDVITLDLVMPTMDGLGVLRALAAPDSPRVVVVSMADESSELGIAALQAGAVELVHKPTSLATQRLYDLGEALVEKVLIAAAAIRRPEPKVEPSPAHVVPYPGRAGLVVVGTSTGGPQALTRLVSTLPATLPVPVVLALHIPPGFTEALARRLHAVSALEVLEAAEGMPLEAGRIVLARAGMHLKVVRQEGVLKCHLDLRPLSEPHRPSVDVLFGSAAEVVGEDLLGVVLTGMGNDGLRGSKAIRARGGTVLNEAESSCVVFGMPRVVREAGLSSGEFPIEAMAGAIAAHFPLPEPEQD